MVFVIERRMCWIGVGPRGFDNLGQLLGAGGRRDAARCLLGPRSMNALRHSDMLVHREAACAWEAQLAIESVARHEDEYEACYCALEDRVSAWVNSGRAASRLLEADELRVVRRWLSQDSARGLAALEDLESLLSSSEAALAPRATTTEEARRDRRMRQWMMVALVVMTAAAIAVSNLG